MSYPTLKTTEDGQTLCLHCVQIFGNPQEGLGYLIDQLMADEDTIELVDIKYQYTPKSFAGALVLYYGY